jgi:asparagine synthase (glutamine-hydrolysing)
MCGIAGFITGPNQFTQAEAERVMQAQEASLSHRGPDHGQTWYHSGWGVGLVHRRLAVVDLTPDGNQPKISRCGRYVVVFNGEIYNYKELRQTLRSKGHSFDSESDTEVMLTAFTELGVRNALPKLFGMFALAVLDLAESKLTLVRDRVGKKPLYYALKGDTLLFGSELRALRAFPGFKPSISPESFALYMQFGALPAPWTIYENVHQLLPGTSVEYDLRSRRVLPEPVAFWSMLESAQAGLDNPFRGSFEEAVDHLDGLVADATRIRMQMDVPWGAFLSGGVDSSLVVAQMQKQSSQPVRTFTIGYDHAEFDESGYAANVARHLGTDHTRLLVTPQEALDLVPRLPKIFDEPLADGSQIPTYLVSKLTRQHVTVALSGDGGDEFFGGYHRHFFAPRLSAFQRWVPEFAVKGLQALSPLVSATLGNDRWDRAAKLVGTSEPQELYRQILGSWGMPEGFLTHPREVATSRLWPVQSYRSKHLADQFMLRDAIRFLVDDVLVKVDRASMSVALETRAPLLDHRIIEFAWTLPLSFKIGNGSGKRVLKELLYRYVPKKLVDRPKMGFGIPLADWLAGPLRPWAEGLLSEKALGKSGLIHPASARGVWTDFLGGKRNRLPLVWATLVFQAWYEEQ